MNEKPVRGKPGEEAKGVSGHLLKWLASKHGTEMTGIGCRWQDKPKLRKA